MSMYWGVLPFLFDKIGTTESLRAKMDAHLLESGLLKRGEVLVATVGMPLGQSGTTNLLKIHRMGESD